MSKVTENDLKRLEDLIIGSFNRLEQGQTALETRLNVIETRLTTLEIGQTKLKEQINEKSQIIEIGQTELKGEIKTLDAKLNGVSERIKIMETAIGKIPDLAEKVGELKNWRQIVIITITATISGVVGWIIRGGNLKP